MDYIDMPAEPANRFASQDVVGACYERGVWNVLFDEGSIPPEFFDLSSGLAGDLIQKLVNYGIRAGFVVRDTAAYSDAFRDFVRESNRSSQARFFSSREAAVAWLSDP